MNDFQKHFNEFDFYEPPPEERELLLQLDPLARQKHDFKESIMEPMRKQEARKNALRELHNTVKKEEVEHEPEPIDI